MGNVGPRLRIDFIATSHRRYRRDLLLSVDSLKRIHNSFWLVEHPSTVEWPTDVYHAVRDLLALWEPPGEIEGDVRYFPCEFWDEYSGWLRVKSIDRVYRVEYVVTKAIAGFDWPAVRSQSVWTELPGARPSLAPDELLTTFAMEELRQAIGDAQATYQVPTRGDLLHDV
ncbi:MAG: hypothetical protein HYU74_04315 [Dechloromonas sp.]|nr:hypothetical protein [Dechloromonas sp.]